MLNSNTSVESKCVKKVKQWFSTALLTPNLGHIIVAFKLPRSALENMVWWSQQNYSISKKNRVRIVWSQKWACSTPLLLLRILFIKMQQGLVARNELGRVKHPQRKRVTFTENMNTALKELRNTAGSLGASYSPSSVHKTQSCVFSDSTKTLRTVLLFTGHINSVWQKPGEI